MTLAHEPNDACDGEHQCHTCGDLVECEERSCARCTSDAEPLDPDGGIEYDNCESDWRV